MQGENTFSYLCRQTETVVLNNLKRLTSKLAKLGQQQSAVEKAEATRKKADLLTANLHRCRQGDSDVEVSSAPSWLVSGTACPHLFLLCNVGGADA